MDYWSKIQAQEVKPKEVAICWLGQAGFVLKNRAGTTVAIDVYFSDCIERIWGPKRLIAPIMQAHQCKPDILIATHHHEDHLDIEALPILMQNSDAVLLTPTSSIKAIDEIGLDKSRVIELNRGQTKTIKDVCIQAVFADHGDYVHDAIGVIIHFDDISIYFTGDTAYVPDKMHDVVGSKQDILIAPINGVFGNMNPEEVSKLAADVNAKLTLPCHFWMFAEHGGNPLAFMEAMKAAGREGKLLCQGEILIYKKTDA